MQFALARTPTESKTVQAGPDAPRYAQCIYCRMPVGLKCLPHGYEYEHTSVLSADECPHLQQMSNEADEVFNNWRQAKLDKVLNVNSK